MLRKAKKELAKKRKEAQEVPEEWARLMAPSTAETDQASLSEGKELKIEDPLGDLQLYYDYSDMFDLPSTSYSMDPWTTYGPDEAERQVIALAGGFRSRPVWERVARSAVMGLFVPPIGALASQAASQDVVMA